MAEDTSKQIAELNQKVDMILEYVNQQRLKSQAVDDLVADASIIGKDVYDSTVKALDDHEVVLDPDQLRELGIRVAQNVGNFNSILDTLGSAMDLMKDVGPIANEVIIDTTKKLHEFEQKGYFEFLREFGQIIDNIVIHYGVEDVRMLADNVVAMLDVVKNLTQPDMLKSIDNAVRIFANLEMDDIPEYSIFKVMREMNTPEMKRTLGFFMTFLKNMSKNTINQEPIN
ncbi:MAG: hypothetical protein DRI97_14360 [Bacteroidetes bacterium]|nr:MAG: hypothetical protein DRI97_14360 [Bacteroidota bacterium]